MTGRIPDEIIQSIRDRLNIVDVVSTHVSLKKAGRNHLGLCPFHAEKTPSFTVDGERGFFHCFGCGAGGTIFTFVMRADNLSFPEAIKSLAGKAGVELPRSASSGASDRERRILLRLNEVAQEHFRAGLDAATGAPARDYLSKRGLSRDIIDRYGLGFCASISGGLVRDLRERGAPLPQAAEIGLVGRRDDGSYYDKLRQRITFPIRNVAGHILGFGARTLGSDPPKYLNSPESKLFHKGDVLYGLFEARQAIRQADRIILVEGYLDALALVDAGIGNVVASLGTALTTRQLRLAHRFGAEIVAFFDGDRAGMDAAARAFAVCAEAGVWGYGAFLPEGFDPDTFVRTQGLAPTQALLQQPIPLADFFVQRNDPGPLATVPQRVRAADRVAEVLSLVKDPTQYNMLVRQAAQRLHVDESVFRRSRSNPSKPRVAGPPAAAPFEPQEQAPARPEELLLVRAIAMDAGAAQVADADGVVGSLSDAQLAAAADRLIRAWRDGGSGLAAVVETLSPALQAQLSAAIVGGTSELGSDPIETARQCIRKIEDRVQRTRVRQLREMIEHAEARGDEAGLREAQRQFQAVLQRRPDASS